MASSKSRSSTLHAASPGMSSSPVTAAVMRAWRCSTRSVDLLSELQLSRLRSVASESIADLINDTRLVVESGSGTCIAFTMSRLIDRSR